MADERGPHLGEMTHAALCAVCEPNELEVQIERIGCASTLVVAAIMGALAAYFAWATHSVIEVLAAGFAVFIGCSISLNLVLSRLTKRRRAPFRAELWRRLPQPFAIEEARAAVRGQAPPDWVLVQTTKFLPHGSENFSRLDVWRNPLRTIAETRSLRFGARGRVAPEQVQPRVVRQEWGPAAIERLVRLLEEEERAPAANLAPWTVIDGSGCSLVIVKKDPYSEKAIHANLGWAEAGPEAPPALALLLVIRDSIERF
jgi:hypothetical protein